MNKIMKVLKNVFICFYFAMMAVVTIMLLTGAFRFAVAFIENRNPDFLEWMGIIFVGLISGCVGWVYFSSDSEQ